MQSALQRAAVLELIGASADPHEMCEVASRLCHAGKCFSTEEADHPVEKYMKEIWTGLLLRARLPAPPEDLNSSKRMFLYFTSLCHIRKQLAALFAKMRHEMTLVKPEYAGKFIISIPLPSYSPMRIRVERNGSQTITVDDSVIYTGDSFEDATVFVSESQTLLQSLNVLLHFDLAHGVQFRPGEMYITPATVRGMREFWNEDTRNDDIEPSHDSRYYTGRAAGPEV